MATEISQDLKTTAHYLVSEASGYRSREQVLIGSGSNVLKSGAVIGKVTASGKYMPYAPGAADGTETASAILFEGCDATSADVRRTITARDAEVHVEVLEWAAGVDDTQKNTALTALAVLGIIGR